MPKPSPQRVFIANYKTLESIIESPTDEKILDASAILRRLLIDGSPLYDIVNRDFRLKLRFEISIHGLDVKKQLANQQRPGVPRLISYAPIDAIDPEKFPGDRIITFNKNKFLELPISIYMGKVYTVRQVILYLANTAGGVHYELSSEKYQDIDTASERFPLIVQGLGLECRTLFSLCIVVFRAITPLYNEVSGSAPKAP